MRSRRRWPPRNLWPGAGFSVEFQAKKRSTTHRRGNTTNPTCSGKLAHDLDDDARGIATCSAA